MPIDDLQTDDYGFPEAGRIRLGIKKKNDKGKEFPSATDYFVMADAQDLIPHYGQQPTELLVYLPYQERDRNFRAWYELYSKGRGLKCQGSGSYINWAVDPVAGGEVVIRSGEIILPYTEQDGQEWKSGQVPCSGKHRTTNPLYPRCLECKRNAVLSLLIRDPKKPNALANNRLAYYSLSTGNARSIVGLTASLNFYSDMAARRNKSLAGIPLILKLVEYVGPVPITNNEGKTERIQKKGHYLTFEADPRWIEFASLGLPAGAMDIPIDQLMLEAGEEDDDDIIDGEGLYVPEELDDLDERLANRIADLEAMKDELPTDWPAYHDIMGEIFDKYSPTDMVKLIRKRLGIGRTKEISLDKTFWNETIDCVIETLRAE